MAAAFGPYLPLYGVRTEQMVVYVIAVGGVLLGRYARIPLMPAGKLILFAMAAYLVIVVGNIAPAPGPLAPGRGYLAGLDTVLLPGAVVCATLWTISGGADPRRLLRIACTVLVSLATVNAVIALLSTTFDLRWLSTWFWSAEPDKSLASILLATEQRFTGLINAPAEAGAIYSVAAVAAIYLHREHLTRLALYLTTIALGGVVAVSKVFLLVGLPVAVTQLIMIRPRRVQRLTLLACVATVGGVLGSLTSTGSSTRHSVQTLLHPFQADDLVGVYTAGRFTGTSGLDLVGDQSPLGPIIDAVMSSSPLIGFGVWGTEGAADNGWIEALMLGGLLAVALYTAILATLVVAWANLRETSSPAGSMFAGGLVAVVILSSVGLAVLTANRTATIAWVLLTLSLLVRRPTPGDGIPSTAGGGVPSLHSRSPGALHVGGEPAPGPLAPAR